MPVTGFLHLADIKLPYALEGTPRANECEVEVKKGIHLTAYVKDVFPNAGRMTLSLDPNMDKDKVGGRSLRVVYAVRQLSRLSCLHSPRFSPAQNELVLLRSGCHGGIYHRH